MTDSLSIHSKTCVNDDVGSSAHVSCQDSPTLIADKVKNRIEIENLFNGYYDKGEQTVTLTI